MDRVLKALATPAALALLPSEMEVPLRPVSGPNRVSVPTSGLGHCFRWAGFLRSRHLRPGNYAEIGALGCSRSVCAARSLSWCCMIVSTAIPCTMATPKATHRSSTGGRTLADEQGPQVGSLIELGLAWERFESSKLSSGPRRSLQGGST